MLYKSDWANTQQKFVEYWNKENHDRPLISITAPKDGYKPKLLTIPDNIEERWMNFEYVIKSCREAFASTFYGGEAFPQLWPNLGPDIFGAILGCDLEFGEHTSWAGHIVKNWDDFKEFKFNPESKWWKKIKQLTQMAVDDSKGDYFVGITDLHPGADGLAALRGPQELCYDLIDCPDEVKRANMQILDVFKIVYEELYSITRKNIEGTSTWMGIWHPNKCYPVSSDFICMISQEMFKDFILEELEEEIAFLDASIFHLDGPGALKHLDALLQIPGLDGIQWVYGAGQPTAVHWIPVLKKIQEAGKLIQVYVEPSDLPVLLEELKPEGVMYVVSSYSPDFKITESDAKDIIARVDASYKRKLF